MQSRGDKGAATAEAAVVLPVITVFCLGLSWLVSLGAVQVQSIDAAREVARAIARGDDRDDSIALGQQVAPDGAQFSVERDAEATVVRVVAPVAGPGGMFAFLPVYRVRAEAVTVTEP